MRISLFCACIAIAGVGCKGVGDKSTGTTTWDLGIPLGNGDGGMMKPGPDMACYKPMFPYTLTPRTPAQTATANITMYFSVTDASHRGVTGLSCGGGAQDMAGTMPQDMVGMGGSSCNPPPANPQPDCSMYFIDQEDNVLVDPTESHLQVEALAGNNLDVPTVLVLDLSGNIVANGSLPKLQAAADTIIDQMLPEQRMAIVAFADQPSVRIGFTKASDNGGMGKKMLHDAIAGLTTANLGVSSNLNGAMVQALGMWQDGFDASNPASTKLTAGMVIVVASGEDQAGVKTYTDVINARGNKTVVAVGVGLTQFSNENALRGMANGCSAGGVDGGVNSNEQCGGYIQFTDYASLQSGISQVTDLIESLAHSIYFATYCSPKRSGGTSQHTVTFSVVGNGSSAISAVCKPAVFTSTAPGQCASIGNGTDTEVCQQANGQVICCPPSAPFWCPPDASNMYGTCFETADQAQNGDGVRPGCGMTCTECGGTGVVSTGNGTDMTPGPAIHVTFTPNGYTTDQCPYFWGPNCKSLSGCCPTLDPGAHPQNTSTTYVQSCVTDLTTATSNPTASAAESACMTDVAKYCPSPVTTNCMALQTCCAGYPAGPARDMCYSALYAAYANATPDNACMTAVGQYCPTAGSMCATLKTCCTSLGVGGQTACMNVLVNGNQTNCMTSTAQYCPTTTNCMALASCCSTFGMQYGNNCYNFMIGIDGSDANCSPTGTYASTIKQYCPTMPNCQKLLQCCEQKSETCPTNSTCVTRSTCDQYVVSSGNMDMTCTSDLSPAGC